MEQKDIVELFKRMDTLSRLLALSIVQGKIQREQIKILDSAGMSRQEIAELLSTTPNTVSVELFNLRKKAKK